MPWYSWEITSLNTSIPVMEGFFLNTENKRGLHSHDPRMIPEPRNKKGAFAPLDNCSSFIFIVRAFKNYLSVCNLKFKLHSCNQGLSFRIVIFIGLGKQSCFHEPKFSQWTVILSSYIVIFFASSVLFYWSYLEHKRWLHMLCQIGLTGINTWFKMIF